MSGPILKRLTVVAPLLFAVACGSSSDDEGVVADTPVEDLYNRASVAFDNENYEQSVRLFEEVERQHPYSRWASRALLMAGYSAYLDNEYDIALGALDRFIQLHPGNKDISYAYYLRALCFYEQIADVQRDQTFAEDARDALGEVVRRFPDTDYARDANLKIDLTNDHLAGKHMEVGRYYLRRGDWLAAINRFREVVQNFQTTTHVPEALHRLTESYLALGVVDEARGAAAVLGHNFPGSDWYQDSYALLQGRSLEPDSSGSWFENLF